MSDRAFANERVSSSTSSQKRIGEWAKDWSVEAREIIARLETFGLHGRKPHSAITAEEAARVRAALGLVAKPTITVGGERLFEAGGQTIMERRVRANVIRRRAVRSEGQTPPTVTIPAPLAESLPGHIEASAPPASVPAEIMPSPDRAEVSAAVTGPAFPEQLHGPKVLGKIVLPKTRAEAERSATPPVQLVAVERHPRPLSPGPTARRDSAEVEVAEDRKTSKRRVIEKLQRGELLGREFRPTTLRKKKRVGLAKEFQKPEITTAKASKRVVRISEGITVGDLAKAMAVKAGEIIKKLIDGGVRATINQVLDLDTASLAATDFGYEVENIAFDAEQALAAGHAAQPDEAAMPRPAVVTVMGHVDHGKTSLLDAIRATNVSAHEAGGITQHIGAYSVSVKGKRVTFIDTPGHEAFTAMRARGAKVTDIVVLVVAADDGVMPQTVEAINHARAAEVPTIVAINKIDKPEADIDRVRRALADHGLVPEDWGGDTICVPVSAKTKQGIAQLLEMVLLQAEMRELKASPNKLARGTVIEARLDRGCGPVATVIVQEGTLKIGDPIICGTTQGRVRSMLDHNRQTVQTAGPSDPVEVLGFESVPSAGIPLMVTTDEATARQVAHYRRNQQRQAEMITTSKVSLEDLYKRTEVGDVKELRVVLKADVQGSVEALSQALARLSTDKVRLKVIHAGVGGISESDVMLAAASDAIIMGFSVRTEPQARETAKQEGVEIRLYSIIYEALRDVRAALEGLLEPLVREKITGRAKVRQVFSIRGLGTVAGCLVIDGKISRGASARLVRDHVVTYDGKISSLRRFKEDAREVTSGYECGIGLENCTDLKPADLIEAYEIERIAAHLTPAKNASVRPVAA